MDYFDQLETRLAELTAAGAHRRRRGLNLAWPRSPLPALALAVSVVVVAAVAGLALSARNSTPEPAPAQRPATSAISPVLVRNYRILRRPVRAGDALPAAFARINSGYELVPRLARRGVIPGTRIEMWLEPGRNGFCVYLAERLPSGANPAKPLGSSCGPARDNTPLVGVVAGDSNSAVGPPALGFSTNEPVLARGIVPDAVTGLVLAHGRGKPEQIKPIEGFFAVPFRPGDRLYAIRHGQADQILP